MFLAYTNLKDEVQVVLSKAPIKDEEKMEKQLNLLELLCQHKVGEVTSTDVTEASKNSKVIEASLRKVKDT